MLQTKRKFSVGQRVVVSAKTNSVWEGEGVVITVHPQSTISDELYTGIKMQTGRMAGSVGAFDDSKIELAPMQILTVKRTSSVSPMKLYGTYLGESGEVYDFAYYRGSRREWICACKNFFFSERGKNGNCKHLKDIRQKLGRYGATVEPTRTLKPATETATS